MADESEGVFVEDVDVAADIGGGALDVGAEHGAGDDFEGELGKGGDDVEGFGGFARAQGGDGVLGAFDHHIEDGVEAAAMEGGLNELALAAPEFAFAGDEAVAHEDAEDEVGEALFLVFGVTIGQDFAGELGRADDDGLAKSAFDAEERAVFVNPLGKVGQWLVLGVVEWAFESAARAFDNGRQVVHGSLDGAASGTLRGGLTTDYAD